MGYLSVRWNALAATHIAALAEPPILPPSVRRFRQTHVQGTIELKPLADGTSNEGGHVVILVHGILSFGDWFAVARSELENSGFTVVPFSFSFVGLIRFLLPLGFRNFSAKRFSREVEDIKKIYPNLPVSVIAHSYGSYAVGMALSKFDISLERVIFCGAVLSRDIDFAHLRGKVTLPIVSECSRIDILPAIAANITWGYSYAGTHGFMRAGVVDRFHELGHSGYFNREFVKRYWVPFLRDGTIIKSDVPRARKIHLVSKAIAAFPIKTMIAIAVTLAIIIGQIPKPLPCDSVWILGGIYSSDTYSATSQFVEIVSPILKIRPKDSRIRKRDIVRITATQGRRAILIDYWASGQPSCDGLLKYPSIERYKPLDVDFVGLQLAAGEEFVVLDIDNASRGRDEYFGEYLRVRRVVDGDN